MFALMFGIGIARSCNTVGPPGRQASRSNTVAVRSSAARPTLATAAFAAHVAPTRLPPAHPKTLGTSVTARGIVGQHAQQTESTDLLATSSD